MKTTMRNIYHNYWNGLDENEDEKKEIIERRSKRLRLKKIKMCNDKLYNNVKERYVKEDFSFYLKENGCESFKLEEDDKLIEGCEILKIKNRENITERKECDKNGTVEEVHIENEKAKKKRKNEKKGEKKEKEVKKEKEYRNKANLMECIFNCKDGNIKECRSKETGRNVTLIRTNNSVFQYPMNVVYVRECYKTIFEYIEAVESEYRYPYCFLLKGNPGIGKTSLAMYLLYMFHLDCCKETIVYCKNVNDRYVLYLLTDDGFIEKEDNELPVKIDVIISESRNYCLKNGRKYKIVIYIGSIDEKNYKKYSNNKLEKLYLDVFSDDEIKEWMEFCLTPKLKKYIEKNNLAKRYGNIPRDMYLAAVYGKYYGRDYWNEIYSRGIDSAIGNLGLIEFIKKYLLPCENGKETLDKTNSFDLTSCHFITKYLSIPNDDINDCDDYDEKAKIRKKLVKVSETEMGFVSTYVVEYLLDSLHHISNNDEVRIICNLLYNRTKSENNVLLNIFLYQELMWYKLIYHIIPKENKIEILNDYKYENKFKKLFKSAIYSTTKKEVYILHFKMLDNRDMIYLVNNCFIHVSLYKEDFNPKDNDDLMTEIKYCSNKLKNNDTFKEFYIISINNEGTMDYFDVTCEKFKVTKSIVKS